MKVLILIALTALLNTAFAGETSTDCPMMRQGRGNPKASMGNQPKKLSTKPATTAKTNSI
jgi:hypothetical protein